MVLRYVTIQVNSNVNDLKVFSLKSTAYNLSISIIKFNVYFNALFKDFS